MAKKKDKDKSKSGKITFKWPCPGYPTITSGFGPRWGSFHQGIDIGAPDGAGIVASADGKVIEVKQDGSRGKYVTLSHGGNYYTRYQHCSSILVGVRDEVKRGKKIAVVGHTGSCYSSHGGTGAHLHFEVLVGGYTGFHVYEKDPTNYVSYNKETDADPVPGGKGNNKNNNDSEEEGTGLPVSPEKLYSSQNYSYVVGDDKKEKSTTQLLKDAVFNLYTAAQKQYEENKKKATENNKSFLANILNEILKNLGDVSANITGQQGLLKSTTMKSGSKGSKSSLPVVSTYVEAPYFECTIGGINFGVPYKGRYVNYIKSLTINKTNGSVSEYHLQLMHQIRLGDNPNYIDNVLSKAGYNKIKIKYGNANTGQVFSDTEALITEVTENFDFTNCNIIYNITALSTSATSVATKRNFTEYTGQPSAKIRELLWNSSSSKELLASFPGMRNQTAVETQGLIPTNDASITIGAVSNISAMEYISLLVSMMVNGTSTNYELSSSQYLLTVTDSPSGSQFKITEVTTNSSGNLPFMYEVNVGYPDDNFVIDFQVNTNFTWSIVYESSKSIPKYDYSIGGSGGVNVSKIPSYYKNEDDVIGERNLWSNLTRYPIEATLVVRGLLQDTLLMQYVRINQYLYGAKRINSGMYIVLEQTDSIGNGVYTTTLKLLRVAGDNEYISVDGRRRT